MTEFDLLNRIDQVSRSFSREDFPNLEEIDRELDDLNATGSIGTMNGQAFIRKFAPVPEGGLEQSKLILVIAPHGLTATGKARLADLAKTKPSPVVAEPAQSEVGG